jgi:hypothetical protein
MTLSAPPAPKCSDSVLQSLLAVGRDSPGEFIVARFGGYKRLVILDHACPCFQDVLKGLPNNTIVAYDLAVT